MTFEGAFLSRKATFLEHPIGSNNVATHTSFHNHPKYLWKGLVILILEVTLQVSTCHYTSHHISNETNLVYLVILNIISKGKYEEKIKGCLVIVFKNNLKICFLIFIEQKSI